MELNPHPFGGPVVYGLDVNSGEGVRTEAWLNGILLAESEQGEIGMASLAIHHDLQPGENVAEVRIGLPGTALDAPPRPTPGMPPANAFATLLLEGDEIARRGDEMQITTHRFARVAWVGREETPPVMLPRVLRLPFTPRQPFVPALWSQGARQPDGIADAVYAESARIADMLRSGDVEGYINAGAVRREHMARCYPAGNSAAQIREKNLSFLAAMQSQPGFAVTMLSRTAAQFRQQADGRLFDWVGPAGEALVTISSDLVEPAPLAFQFSVLAGRLTLVR